MMNAIVAGALNVGSLGDLFSASNAVSCMSGTVRIQAKVGACLVAALAMALGPESSAQTQCISAANPTRPEWVAADSNPNWGAAVAADRGTFVMMDAPASGGASRVAIFGPDSNGNIIEKQKISLGARATRIEARGGVLAVAFSTAPQVRVFHRNASGIYSEAASLAAPSGASGFGAAVSVGNDGLSLVVGAPMEGSGPFGSSGAVYVYSRATSSSLQWTQVARLIPAGGSTGNEKFGQAVAIDGNRIVAGGFGITWQIRLASFSRNGNSWVSESDRTLVDVAAFSTSSPWIGLIGEWLIMPYAIRPVCFGCSTYSGPAFTQLNLTNGSGYAFTVPQGFGPSSGFAARDGMLAVHRQASQAGGSLYSVDYYEFDPPRGKYYPYSFLTSGHSGSNYNSGQYAAAVDSYHYVSTDRSAAWGALSNYGAAIIGTARVAANDCNSNGQIDACEIRAGTARDINLNGIPDVCESTCRLADFNGDGSVSGTDLGQLLGAWGTAVSRFDLDGDGTVNGTELGLLLGAWGPCPQ
jgi:hypothetical protein